MGEPIISQTDARDMATWGWYGGKDRWRPNSLPCTPTRSLIASRAEKRVGNEDDDPASTIVFNFNRGIGLEGYGGWTSPLEIYARQNGKIFHKFRGENSKRYVWNHETVYHGSLQIAMAPWEWRSKKRSFHSGPWPVRGAPLEDSVFGQRILSRIRQRKTTVRKRKKHFKRSTHTRQWKITGFLTNHLELVCVFPVHSLEDNYVCLYCVYLHTCVYLEPKLWHPCFLALKNTSVIEGQASNQRFTVVYFGATLNIHIPSTYDVICIPRVSHIRKKKRIGKARHTSADHWQPPVENLQLLKGTTVGKVLTRRFNLWPFYPLVGLVPFPTFERVVKIPIPKNGHQQNCQVYPRNLT